MSSGKTKIPDHLADLALELSGQLHPTTQKRWTSAQIADWLRDEHAVDVTPRTVSNLLHGMRAEVATALQDGVRHLLLTTLAPQLSKLDDLLEKLATDADHEDTKPGLRMLIVDNFRKGLETKLKFAGVGEKVTLDGEVGVNATVDVRDARRALAAALAGEDEGADAGASGAGIGETT